MYEFQYYQEWKIWEIGEIIGGKEQDILIRLKQFIKTHILNAPIMPLFNAYHGGAFFVLITVILLLIYHSFAETLFYVAPFSDYASIVVVRRG